jgi:hypothetical protein
MRVSVDVMSVTVQWLVGRIYKGDNGGRWSITSMFMQDMPPAATQEDAKREFARPELH